MVDRRDFYWEDLEEFEPAEFLPSLLKQLYLDAAYLPRYIHTPMDFEDRALLEEVLTEASRAPRGNSESAARAETRVSRTGGEQRASIRSCSASACLKPSSKAIAEALESALGLPEPPKRIESFDISHIQGSDTVASMVVWEDGTHEKIRLPEIHHSRRGDAGRPGEIRGHPARRFRQHARSRRAALPAVAAKKASRCRA